jgi:hypothetical protein
MEWQLFWIILAQLGITAVIGILFSAIVSLWTVWWRKRPTRDLSEEDMSAIVEDVLDKITLIGRNNDN